MEDIYTIKVRTNPDPRDLYPSERRYSASTVLGLGVVHLALATTALLLASLSLSAHAPISKSEVAKPFEVPRQYENFTDFANSSVEQQNGTQHEDSDLRNDDMAFLDEDNEASAREDEVLIEDDGFQIEDIYNPFISLTLAPCLMSVGALAAGFTGLLAWKRWYIDQNIRWFFFMSSISTLTSLACLTVTGLTIGIVTEQQNQAMAFSNGLQNGNAFIFSFRDNNVYVDRLQQSVDSSNTQNIPPNMFANKHTNTRTSNIKLVLAINLLIASVLEFVWSVLSTKISWKGMRNDYPDDIVLSRGKMEVNTIHKGNKKTKAIAPDILNHHPKKRKFAKYFPKKENDYLPKAESNIEYQERVNRFLSSNVSESDN